MMKLSPANLIGIRARAMPAKPLYEEYGSDIEEVTMYRCPVCLELHEYECDAEECCEGKREQSSGTMCPVCGEPANSHRDAADCCLWKDLDAPTRWRIADAVEAGSSWAKELGVEPNIDAPSKSVG